LISPGARRAHNENNTVVKLTFISPCPPVAATWIARATISGWYTGAIGRPGSPMWETAWSKNGVFTAGGNRVVRRTWLRSCDNSARTAWSNPRMACLAPE